METTYLYLLLDGITLALPLLLSFDRKVAFYKRWNYLFAAILFIGTPFIIWDIWFTAIGVWGFNERYLWGPSIAGLPLEEWLFFIAVPYASVFIYDCVKTYFPSWQEPRRGRIIAVVLAVGLLILGVFHLSNSYTSITFLSLAFLLGFLSYKRVSYFGWFFVAYLLVLIPFFGVNGILTGFGIGEEVVWYNDAENLGIRIVTIPIEDAFYGMLLALGNVAVYEGLQKRWEGS